MVLLTYCVDGPRVGGVNPFSCRRWRAAELSAAAAAFGTRLE